MTGVDSGEGIAVLHIDDDPQFLEMASSILEREDERLDVTTATDGESGLELLAETPFDCIVCDYQMPGMDGIEVLEAVRETHPNLPFILFTGKGDEEVASHAISAGVTDYVQKGTGTTQYSLLAHRLRNIIQQRRTQEQIRAASNRLREVYEHIAQSVVVLDIEQRVTYIDSGAAELLDLSADAVVGERLADALDYGFIDELERTVGSALKRQEATAFDAYVPALDRRLRFSAAPAEDGVTVFMTPKRTEPVDDGKLQLTDEDQLSRIPIGIVVVDADGTIRQVNNMAEGLLGLPRGRLVDRSYEALPWDESAELSTDTAEHPFLHVSRTKEPVSGRFRRAERGDVEREIRVNGKPILDEDDEVEAVVLGFSDITELVEEADRTTERLDRLLSALSHDIKSPLAVARGRLELLDVDGEHADELRDALDEIDSIIRKLVALGRADIASINRTTVDIERTVVDIWGTVSNEHDSLHIDSDPGAVEADETQFRRAIRNVLENAVQHTTGPVEVEVGRTEEGFYIADDGDGLGCPAERAFEFGVTTDPEGTGIGLAVVESVAEAHGWSVEAAGSDDGTTFRFQTGETTVPRAAE